MSDNARLYLSPPHMCGRELDFVQDAFRSNWIAPLGPHVDAFEREFARLRRRPARRRALLGHGGAAPGAAAGSASGRATRCSARRSPSPPAPIPIVVPGRHPGLRRQRAATWNMDPALLARRARRRGAPRAACRRPWCVVHLYGQSADIDPILEACERHGVPADRGRGRGARRDLQGRPAGHASGRFGVFSFNGNKIITTSGGGMLVVADETEIARPRASWRRQARDAGAALRALRDRLQLPAEQRARRHRPRAAHGAGRPGRQRRAIFAFYREAPGDAARHRASCPRRRTAGATAGLPASRSTPPTRGFDRETLRLALERDEHRGAARCGSRCTSSRCSATVKRT